MRANLYPASGAGIMRVVKNTSTTLRLRDHTFWISLICFAGAAFLLGYVALHGEMRPLIAVALFVVFGLAFLRSTEVAFDKAACTCTLSRLDVFRVRRRMFRFDEIKNVKVEVEPMNSDRQMMSCRLCLVTASDTVPLTATYEPDEVRYRAMREAIMDAVFAKGTKPVAADPVEALVQEGRLVDAIRMLREREGLDLTTAKARVEEMRGRSSP